MSARREQVCTASTLRISLWKEESGSARTNKPGWTADDLVAAGAVEEGTQLGAERRMPQLAESLGFNLANAFAGDCEILTDFFQRVVAAVVQSEAHLNDLFFTRRQRLQYRLRHLFQ